MSNTRENILLSARALFNAHGFSNVTIRMIALDLSMSSGNLNYHFKKREDILEALYFQMVKDFDERIEQLKGKEMTLQVVKEDMISSLNRMLEYRFFWTDLYNLLRLNKNIKDHFILAYENRFNGYLYLFKILNEKGVMKPFNLSIEKRYLIERMIGFSNTWLYNSFLYGKEVNKEFIRQQSDQLLFMLFPYLTQSGKSEFQRTVTIS